MFSLIITIISIALVAALALATLYYGGDAFNQGRAGAEASRLINEGQQVNGAATLGAATGATVTDIASLVTADLLTQVPAGVSGATLISAGEYTIAGVEDAVCDEVETRAGQAANLADLAAAEGSAQVFGCFGTADAPRTFFYKF